MTVKEILTNVAYLLDDNRLIVAITDDIFIGNLLNDKKLLVKCVNFINNMIATEYFPLTDVVEVRNTSGVIPFSDVSTNTIFDVIEIVDNFGQKVQFKITDKGIETAKGKLKIRYNYLPNEVDYLSNITCYPIKINSRIFAYGVVGEYLFIKGNFDDGEVWDNRFKNSMLSIQRKRKEIVMRKRRWE